MATATTDYRLSQATTSHGKPTRVYVAGYVDYGNGTIGYSWTSLASGASRFKREAACAAAQAVEKDQAAWRETKSAEYRAEHPQRPVDVRPITGGNEVQR